jgi:cell division septation protein DedD
MSTLGEAIAYIGRGDREIGRQMLEEILEEDEVNEKAWLWLSSVVESDEDREICLENVLTLNPDNRVAQKSLEALQSGTFNADELMSDVLADEEKDEDEVTFLDDFLANYDDDDDDEDIELVMPGALGGSRPKKKSGVSPNPRLFVLVGLLVVILLVLGAVAVFTLSGGGESILVETPADTSRPEETPTPTDTPTPAPTETPAATFTPVLQLPTAKPTLTPSPTATQVVSPTPGN